MKKFYSVLSVLLLFAALLHGAERLEIASNGTLKIGSASILVICKENSGRLQNPGKETFIKNHGISSNAGNTVFSADLNFSVGSFALREELKKIENGKYLFTAALSAPEETKVNELTLLLHFPAGQFAGSKMVVNGKPVTLPEKFVKRHVFSANKFQSLSWIEGDTEYTVSGSGNINFQDARCDNWNVFAFFTTFTPFTWKVKNAVNKLTITAKPVRTTTVPLASVCNMGFADDTAGDGKGGWTDQGGSNDLRVFPVGRRLYNDVIFDVIDPKTNNGKSCLVLSSNPAMKFKSSAVVPLTTSGKYLTLLHAAAFVMPEVGKIEVTYMDKSSSVFSIQKNKHVADWWVPSSISDGEVVWSDMNDSSLVGIYGTSFPLKDKPLEKITFSTNSGAVWMIAAATVSDIPIARVNRTPVYTAENREWKKLEFPRSVQKGSVLDFSLLGLQDAPAGKYGFLKATPKGLFEFEKTPGKNVRFYGTNLCFEANFPKDRAMAEMLADRIAAQGYNSVRFHHFDMMFDESKKSSTELHPEMLDRLEMLFAALKSRGIYIMIDLYCTRSFFKGELPGFEDLNIKRWYEIHRMKAYLLFTDAGFENFKTFARNLLTHVNPYTKLAWKDDPALILMGCINEDAVFFVNTTDQRIRDILEKQFEAANPGLKGEERSRAYKKFLISLYGRNYKRMADFLKNELGVKALITDQNHWQQIHQAPMNARYDFVDKHMYWSHPTFTNGKICMAQGSYISRMGGAAIHGNSASRVMGKPFAASEMNYAFPSICRAEGGLLLGAYASLQDWSAVYQFCYLDKLRVLNTQRAADIFELASDPVMFLFDKQAVLLYLRRDVRPSDVELPIFVPGDFGEKHSVYESYPPDYYNAGTVAKIGAGVDDRNGCVADAENFSKAEFLKNVQKKLKGTPGVYDPDNAFAVSSSGELEINGKNGIFKVNTPRTAGVVLPEGKSASAGLLTVKNRKSFSACSVSALDGRNIADSGRMLFLHITNVFNSRMRFSDKTFMTCENTGTLPLLAQRGIADIVLKLSPGATPRVYAVDLSGKRIQEIPSEFINGTFKFTADVFAASQPCFVYEIVR
ncbi:MAG: hypothetical protein J6C40_10540 [Lentisphaeria bacterium]|nr:hypothetical protein [Lentisphaeria bacterium]